MENSPSDPDELITIAKIQLYKVIHSWIRRREREIKQMEQNGVSEEWIEKYNLVLESTRKFVESLINGP